MSGRPSGVCAGRTLVSARAAPTLAGLTSAGERTALLPACGPELPQQARGQPQSSAACLR